MKILVISYAYHPETTPRAYRWTAICEEWAREGHTVHVITASRGGRSKIEVNSHVSLHRVGGLTERLRSWISGRSGKGGGTSHEADGDRGGAIGNPVARWGRRLARSVYDVTWKMVYWPDATCFWIGPTVRYAKALHAHESFDALVTVSHPFSAHMVGLRMKRSFPELYWLADNGDPFSFLDASPPNNYALYRRLNLRTEERIIRRADGFAVTTERAARVYHQLMPASDRKVTVVPPAMPEAYLRRTDHEEGESLFDPRKTIATYVGGWHKGVREPDGVLRLLEDLYRACPELAENLQWHVYGHLNLIEAALAERPSLAGRVFLHGIVPRESAFRALCQSHVLINVGNHTEYQVPSKLVEYIASGRPILNICTRADDSSAEFLAGHATTLDVNVNSETEVGKVAEFVKHSRSLSSSAGTTALEEYTVAGIATQYKALMTIRDHKG